MDVNKATLFLGTTKLLTTGQRGIACELGSRFANQSNRIDISWVVAFTGDFRPAGWCRGGPQENHRVVGRTVLARVYAA